MATTFEHVLPDRPAIGDDVLPVRRRELTITVDDVYDIAGRLIELRQVAPSRLEFVVPKRLEMGLRCDARALHFGFIDHMAPVLRIAGIAIVPGYDTIWATLTSTVQSERAAIERWWFTEHPIGRALVGLEDG